MGWFMFNIAFNTYKTSLVVLCTLCKFIYLLQCKAVCIPSVLPLMIHLWHMVASNMWFQHILSDTRNQVLDAKFQNHAYTPEKLHLTPDFKTLLLTCYLKTLCLMPARCQPGATFRNQASYARFQNQASDIIFCDHASDVQYESAYVVYDLKFVVPTEFKLISSMPEQIKSTTMHFC